MEWLENTIYINLDSRTDRKERMEAQLASLKIKGIRMSAIEHQYGAIGCTLSHIACLQYAKEHKFPKVCILEDDAMVATEEVFTKKMEYTKQLVGDQQWDVLLLGANNYRPFDQLSFDYIRVYNAQSAVAYIVKESYYDRLIENMIQSVALLKQEPLNKEAYALDMYWKKLQQVDTWYFVIPTIVVQFPGYSDIEKRDVNYMYLMMNYDKTK